MTIQENARLTCDRMVSEYDRSGSKSAKDYWGMLSYIANSYLINAISDFDVERYCYHLRIDFDRLMSAPIEYKSVYLKQSIAPSGGDAPGERRKYD